MAMMANGIMMSRYTFFMMANGIMGFLIVVHWELFWILYNLNVMMGYIIT